MPLKKRRDGHYEARYYRDGVKSSPYLRRDLGPVAKDEAKRIYAELLAEAATRRAVKRTPDVASFSGIAADYLETHGPKMTPKGLARSESIVRQHLEPEFGTRRVSGITAADVERFLAQRVKDGAAQTTANREWNVLRAVLRWAHRKLGVDVPALGRVDAYAEGHGSARVVFATPAEWRALVTAFDDETRFRAWVADKQRKGTEKRGKMDLAPRVYGGSRSPESEATGEWRERLRAVVPVFYALLYTGQRLNTVLALRWKDVDLRRGEITFPSSSSTKRSTTIPLADHLPDGRVNELRSILERRRGLPEVAVFAGITSRQVQRAIDTAREITRLSDGTAVISEAITPHALRHTFGSWLAMEGVSLRVIQELLGHATPMITARHYAHLSPSSDVVRAAIATVREVSERE